MMFASFTPSILRRRVRKLSLAATIFTLGPASVYHFAWSLPLLASVGMAAIAASIVVAAAVGAACTAATYQLVLRMRGEEEEPTWVLAAGASVVGTAALIVTFVGAATLASPLFDALARTP